MKASEFKIKWKELNKGKEDFSLISYSSEELNTVPIKSSTKEFLITSGLPWTVYGDVRFGLKPLANFKSDFNLNDDYYSRFFTIGESDSLNFCIDCSSNDKIVTLDIDRILNYNSGFGKRQEAEIVNSSINQLAESFLTVRSVILKAPDDPDQDQKEDIISRLRIDLELIDPEAFNNEGFWNWTVDSNTFL